MDQLREHFRHGDVDWAKLATTQRGWLPLADAWWHASGAQAGDRLADVGSGPAVFAARYAELGANVTAVDLNADALARAPKRTGLTTLVHDAEWAPLPAPHDVIFLTDVLHHAGSPGMLLRNLRSSGKVLLVGELDPDGRGEVGIDPAHRLPAGYVARMLRDAGWNPEPPTVAPFEHYAIRAS